MEENETVEISKEVLLNLLKKANIEVSSLTSDDIAVALMESNNSQSKSNKTEEDSNYGLTSTSRNILVVDDIGIVTYQLKVMLTNLGYEVQDAKDIYNGINKFLKTDFAYLIMDLFVSTEQEGFMLLNEVKKIIAQKKLKTKIIVITASNRSENKVKCLNSGADAFIRKEAGWQDALIKIIEGE